MAFEEGRFPTEVLSRCTYGAILLVTYSSTGESNVHIRVEVNEMAWMTGPAVFIAVQVAAPTSATPVAGSEEETSGIPRLDPMMERYPKPEIWACHHAANAPMKPS